MTRQTWTALLSAVLFVALAAALALVPAPYVTWTPGDTTDTLGTVGSDPVVEIRKGPSYPTTGRLDLTTVSVTRADSWVSLPEAVAAYWLPRRDALPREWVYPEGVSPSQVQQLQQMQMQTSQDMAIVAALRAAGIEVVRVPSVAKIEPDSVAHRYLEVGDLILKINGRPVKDGTEVQQRIRAQKPGDLALFEIVRDRTELILTVVLGSIPERPGVGWLGIIPGVGYQYEPEVYIHVGRRLGGPSAGFILALALYDKLTPGALLGDLHVAGTGTIDDTGKVGRIDGVQQKLAAAERARADVFLVPAANCDDLVGVRTDVSIVKVLTLSDAIRSLSLLNQEGAEDQVPRC